MRLATAGPSIGAQVHRPQNVPSKSRCAVCKLDSNCAGKGEAGVMENTHVCSEQSCERMAHSGFLSKPRKIHSLSLFAGMTCFEMLHSPLGRETWGHKDSSQRKVHSVNCSHPLVQGLRASHGLPTQAPRKRRAPQLSQSTTVDDPHAADTEETKEQQQQCNN